MKDKIINLLKSNLFLSIVLNVLILAFCILITSFAYESSDDFLNSLYICRYHYYYNNDINYILSTLVGSIQFVLPGYNCFILTQIMLSFFAFTAITFVFADKFGKTKAIVFSAFINILFSLAHYSDIQSSKTAALLLVSGFLLVLNAIRNKHYSLPCWVGIAEILFGSFLNFYYFFIALAFAIAFFFAELIAKRKYKIKFRKFFWFFRPYLLLFAFITALVFGGYNYSVSVNNSSAEASQFYQYSQLTDSINTLSYPNYKDHKAEFEAIGVSENDYELLKNGYYDADRSLNNNALQLVQQIQQSENTKNVLDKLDETFFDQLMHLSSFDVFSLYLIVFVILAGLYIFVHKKRFTFFPVFYLLIAIASSVFLRLFFTSASYLLYGIWPIMFVLLLFSFNFDEFVEYKTYSVIKMRRGPLFVSSGLLLCLLLCYTMVYQAHLDNLLNDDKPSSLYAEIDRHPERYYVLDPVTASEYMRYTENYLHPLWGYRSTYLNNIDGFGYFNNTSQLALHNLPDNIYQAVLSNKKIYIIDNGITYKKEIYLKNNYAINDSGVVYNQTDEINGYKIYEVETN